MKKFNSLIILLFLICLFFSCQTTKNLNPAASGFNATDSDAKAIKIADEVMIAMGGRKNWDDTKIISWNFFGARKLAWNKHTGDVRIKSDKERYTVLMNIFTDKGKVMKRGELIQNPDSLQYYLQKGKEAWINDSYWLVMPFKLKDSGVRLKYLGESTTDEGAKTDLLELTFVNVGTTPENKYHVHIDKLTRLVSQWDFYSKANDPEPRFKTPWKSYQKYGNILLSSSRGKNYELTDIIVRDEVPPRFFSDFK